MFHVNSASAFLSMSCGEGQTAVRSKVSSAAYAAAIPLDWNESGPVTSQSDGVFQGTFDELPDVNGGPETTSARAPNFGFSYLSHPSPFRNGYNCMDANFPTTLLAPTPDTDTAASTPSEATWDESINLPAQPVAEPQGYHFACTSMAVAMPSYAEPAYLFEQGPFDDARPPCVDDDGGFIRQHSTAGATFWGSADISVPHLPVVDTSAGLAMLPGTEMAGSPRTILGKRPRGAEETSDGCVQTVNTHSGPCKRAKRRVTANGALEAAGSTSRSRGTRTPIRLNGISEAAGRGVGRLAAPSAHELYHQLLPGPSVQELMGAAAQGKLPWIEGSEAELTQHHASSVVQQDTIFSAKDGEREDGGFKITRRLSQRCRALLRASPDDWARGSVEVLKCRLCPDAAFANWEDFKRHCNLSEAHPFDIHFCKYCGDFFARPDSLKRHQTSRPPECLSATPTEADVKRQATNRAYEAFSTKLEGFLRGEEKDWTPFGQIIKDLLPSTSKRGSRQQSRLKAPRAESA